MLDRIKALQHTADEVKDDLKQENNDATGAGQPDKEVEQNSQEEATFKNEEEAPEESNEESGVESDEEAEQTESIEELKARLAKAESDRDNYKQGLLEAKAKRKTPSQLVNEKQEKVDIAREKILDILNEENERKALREVINPQSQNYIPELIDDSSYMEIIGYLPRNFDRTSPDRIARALKIATYNWKVDKGIKITKKDIDSGISNFGNLPPSRAGQSVKPEKKHILPRKTSPQEWYKK